MKEQEEAEPGGSPQTHPSRYAEQARPITGEIEICEFEAWLASEEGICACRPMPSDYPKPNSWFQRQLKAAFRGGLEAQAHYEAERRSERNKTESVEVVYGDFVMNHPNHELRVSGRHNSRNITENSG